MMSAGGSDTATSRYEYDSLNVSDQGNCSTTERKSNGNCSDDQMTEGTSEAYAYVGGSAYRKY